MDDNEWRCATETPLQAVERNVLFKVNGYAYRGSNSFSFLLPIPLGVNLKEKNLLTSIDSQS